MIPLVFSFVGTSQCNKQVNPVLTIRQDKVYCMELDDDDDGYWVDDKYIE